MIPEDICPSGPSPPEILLLHREKLAVKDNSLLLCFFFHRIFVYLIYYYNIFEEILIKSNFVLYQRRCTDLRHGV